MPRFHIPLARLLSGLSVLSVIMGLALLMAPAFAGHPEADVNENGMHVPSWFQKSTMDLGQDLKAANAAGKTLAIFWEQKGCTYCLRMHEVNLRDEATYKYIRDNFYVVQLDMRGERNVTDLDGSTMEESDMSHVHGINGTPNVEFIGADGTRVFHMPGFAELPLFLNVFEYVAEGGYSDASLRDWLMARAAAQAG